MTPDRERLKSAIDTRAGELRLRLRQVASRAQMSEPNLYRIRNGEVSLTPTSQAALEDALEWERGSIQDILNSGIPTVRRKDPDEPSHTHADARASRGAPTASELPEPIQLMLEDGRVVDYDLITLPGEDGPAAFIGLAHPGKYATEDERAELKRRVQEFRRIVERVRREVNDIEASRTQPDAQE